MANHADTAVVRDVEVFVRVGGEGIGESEAVDEMFARGTGGGPETEGAVDVNPRVRAVLAGDFANFADGIESAGIHVADLRAEDDGCGGGIEVKGLGGGGGDMRDIRGDHAALPIDGDAADLRGAEAEDGERFGHGDVNFVTDKDGNRRRAEEALALEVPAGVAQDLCARGGEGGDVGHLCAGGEAAAAGGGQAENFKEPAEDDVFEIGGDRRKIEERGVLIPGDGDPVGGDGDRERAAEDAAEVASAGGGDGAGAAELLKQGEGFVGVEAASGEWTGQFGEIGEGFGSDAREAFGNFGEVAAGDGDGLVEKGGVGIVVFAGWRESWIGCGIFWGG